MSSFARLSAIEAAFIEGESVRTPMHVGALSRFEGAPLRDTAGGIRVDEIRALVAGRLGLVPRLRQKVRTAPFGFGRPVWEDDMGFDVAHHVNVTTLPAPGGDDQLRHLVEHLHMQLLDRAHPLWELWFVDGLADGTVGLVEKIHHAMVDGVAGVELAMVLLDLSPEGRPVDEQAWEPIGVSVPSLVMAAVAERVASPCRAVRSAWSAATHPGATLESAGRLADALTTVVRRPPWAPPSSLNRPVGPRRSFEAVRQSLTDVRETRAELGGTINDVVLAAVAGGLRFLLDSRGQTVGRRPLQALVPVSVRSAADCGALGNRVAAMVVPLPTAELDPRLRLRAVMAVTQDLKRHGQAQVSTALLDAAERLPEPAVAAMARSVHHQPFVNLVVTNVPGPQQPLYLMGARMLETLPIVPLSGNMDVSIGIMSYDGMLALGLWADTDNFSDLCVLAEGIDKAFAELRYAAHEEPATDRPAVAP